MLFPRSTVSLFPSPQTHTHTTTSPPYASQGVTKHAIDDHDIMIMNSSSHNDGMIAAVSSKHHLSFNICSCYYHLFLFLEKNALFFYDDYYCFSTATSA